MCEHITFVHRHRIHFFIPSSPQLHSPTVCEAASAPLPITSHQKHTALPHATCSTDLKIVLFRSIIYSQTKVGVISSEGVVSTLDLSSNILRTTRQKTVSGYSTRRNTYRYLKAVQPRALRMAPIYLSANNPVYSSSCLDAISTLE